MKTRIADAVAECSSLCLVVCLAACATYGERAAEDGSISIAELPQNVRAAAEKAVPGIVLEEAEVEQENGATVYEVEGKAAGKEYEIEINSSGDVLEVEEEADDGD